MHSQNTSLSVIILNYNTRDLLMQCVESLVKIKDEANFEVVVVDNGSTDDSISELKKLNLQGLPLKIVLNSANLGFAKGNNAARQTAAGKYILFLNSDTIVNPGSLSEPLKFLEDNKDIGVVTVKQVLKHGQIDPDSRRSFPTPWVALTHFSFLDRIFPKSTLFSRYWYGFKDPNEIHDIEVAQGAYFLTRKEILDVVGWFSEEYFLDGEDIDLSWKIKEKGYRIVYYPKVWIHHLKKQTKKLNKTFVGRGVDSMLIFYKKSMWNRYPFYLNWLVVLGVTGIKLVRKLRTLVGMANWNT